MKWDGKPRLSRRRHQRTQLLVCQNGWGAGWLSRRYYIAAGEDRQRHDQWVTFFDRKGCWGANWSGGRARMLATGGAA